MRNEIKRRKKRFAAVMLALLLLLNQLPPISAGAADAYSADGLSEGQTLKPGDTISTGADISCAVTYYDSGDSGTVLSEGTITQTTVHTVPEYTGTLSSGFEFTGWQVSSVSTVSGGAVESITLSAMVAINGTQISESLLDTTLSSGTVIYSATDSYTITYYDQDGSTTLIDAAPINANTPYTVQSYPGTAPTGYRFTGWKVSYVWASGGSGTIDLTAQLATNQYTITFDTNGGSSVSAITADYGAAVTTPENPTKTGYTFAGWDKEIPATMPAENTTITALWTANKYTIRFENEDGTQLQSSEVAYGEVPVYSGETPTKAGTAELSYTFAGWTPEITAVTGDATYTATFTSSPRKYTVTFLNEDGTELQSSEVAYGETPVYSGETPTKAATVQYAYTFAGWDAELAPVTGDASYTATFTESIRQYTIQFVNEDGTLLQSVEVAYGETPAYSSETPTKAATAGYSYTFAGWTPEIVAASEDATYTAAYTAVVNQYTITFDTAGGSAVAAITADYGAAVTAPADPTKTGYTFAGWDKEIPATMPGENITITAQWTANRYTVKFMDEDGTELQSSEVAYGEIPSYTGATPTKAATAQVTYTFTGWTPAITAVTGDATYTVSFSESARQYTIQFVNEDGTELQSSAVAYGETPVYEGALPVKSATAEVSYIFSGWTPEIAAATGDATYTAIFTELANQYTITFDTDGGSEIAAITADYGSVITAPADPTKTGFRFAGWDVEIPTTMPAENKTIKAQWTINQYTITFDTDGGSEIASITQDYGTTVTAPADPTKTGYTFAGWDKTIPTAMPAEDLVITAQWDANKYTIRFVDDDGTQLQSSEVAYGETPVYGGAIPAGSATPQYTYTFAGWSPEVTTVTGDATYTAVYTQTANRYTITFDTSGGSEIASITQDYGTTVTAPANPTRTGYTFAGWDKTIPATMPAENMTITAQWTAQSYSIQYVLNGGTNGENPSSYTYGTGVSGFANAVKPGYDFVGWYESADFSGEKVTSVAPDRMGDVTLYAKFEMGTIEVGPYYLTAGVAYKLGNVTQVSGDSSVYTAGSIFYVSASGTYIFS